MAVYERTYSAYDGPLTARRTRFLIVPRYAYREIFRSKIFIGFYVLCFVWPLVQALLMYASYNLTFLERLAALTGNRAEPGSLFIRFDAVWFQWFFLLPQFWLGFVLTMVVGPALISADLQNNGLPLYLSRPFGRWDYIAGKFSVLAILLSLITWVPGLLLFLLHAYLAGKGWLWRNLEIAVGLSVGSAVSIVVLGLVSLSLSAYVRWRPVAGIGLFAVFILGSALANMINLTLGTTWGSVIDIGQLLAVAWSSLFRVEQPFDLPPAVAWLSLAAICGLFLWVLLRRVRAYEVVR